jgi:hypothetical protein
MKNYLIINVEELNKVDFNCVEESSINTLRLSVNKLKTFVKWTGNTPEFVKNISNPQVLSKKQIEKELKKNEWSDFENTKTKK